MNSYEDGGIKMTDIKILVKAVRLAWRVVFTRGYWNNDIKMLLLKLSDINW